MVGITLIPRDLRGEKKKKKRRGVTDGDNRNSLRSFVVKRAEKGSGRLAGTREEKDTFLLIFF